jgi:hypothetical protein
LPLFSISHVIELANRKSLFCQALMDSSVIFVYSLGNDMLKKDLTVREHLKTIQSDGGKARWAKLTPEDCGSALGKEDDFRSSSPLHCRKAQETHS